MQEDFSLKADISPIELDQSGITLVAPGLIGNGTWFSRRVIGETRDATGEKSALDGALAEADLEDRHTLVIEAPTPAAATGTGRVGGGVADDEILMQVPTAENEAALAIYIDEAGIISFHYPQTTSKATAALPTRTFGAARLQQFRIPLRPGKSKRPTEGRGMVGRIVAKIIKIVIVKLLPDEAGTFVSRRVKAWEDKHRAFQGLHGGTWPQLLDPTPLPFSDFGSLAGKKVLLFLHGTTSATAGAFGALKQNPALLDRLYRAYENRVIGFNHHTMTDSVAENVRQFYAAFAPAPGRYSFDIVCHSRGGLVARALTHLADSAISKTLGQPWARPSAVKLTIDRIVFVATPNGGTQLAEPTRVPQFVERLTNYVNMLPDSAVVIASGALLSIAAALAEVALPRLPGLADQAPESPLLRELAPPARAADRFFAFRANYEANGDLLDIIKDHAVDRIFEQMENDLVVPTEGVSKTSRFDLPVARLVSFGPGTGVHHTNFFAQTDIAKMADFLEVP
jgi:pimeloyl-ACP methyl ester carboxylesterase